MSKVILDKLVTQTKNLKVSWDINCLSITSWQGQPITTVLGKSSALKGKVHSLVSRFTLQIYAEDVLSLPESTVVCTSDKRLLCTSK